MIGNASCGRTRTDFCVRIGVASLAADKIHCINFLSAPNTNTGPTNRESRKGIPEADNGPGITRASDRAIQGLCLMHPIFLHLGVNMPRTERVGPFRVSLSMVRL